MKTFIGIDLPVEVKRHLYNIQNSLQPLATHGKWKSDDNYHITLKFLGVIDEEVRAKVDESMQKITQSITPFQLSLTPVDFFGPYVKSPEEFRARVLWVGVKGVEGDMVGKSNTNALNTAQHVIEEQMRVLGFMADERDFNPHITLGQAIQFTGDMASVVNRYPLGDVTFEVNAFQLFKSERINDKMVYTPISTYALLKKA